MFPVVDRYVLFEWLKIFGLVLGAMFGLQLIVEVQDSSVQRHVPSTFQNAVVLSKNCDRVFFLAFKLPLPKTFNQ